MFSPRLNECTNALRVRRNSCRGFTSSFTSAMRSRRTLKAFGCSLRRGLLDGTFALNYLPRRVLIICTEESKSAFTFVLITLRLGGDAHMFVTQTSGIQILLDGTTRYLMPGYSVSFHVTNSSYQYCKQTSAYQFRCKNTPCMSHTITPCMIFCRSQQNNKSRTQEIFVAEARIFNHSPGRATPGWSAFAPSHSEKHNKRLCFNLHPPIDDHSS